MLKIYMFRGLGLRYLMISMMDETGVQGENFRPARFELTKLLVIGTDCIGSSLSSYHTSTATAHPVDA
jgi:hypothetical protein